MNHTYIKIAGIVNLLTAFLHLFGGQIDLIDPLLVSDITTQQKGELIGVWHMISILLFFTAFIILRSGFKKRAHQDKQQLKTIGNLYLLIGIPSIIVSVWFQIVAPQWILLLPIGVLLLLGIKKTNINE